MINFINFVVVIQFREHQSSKDSGGNNWFLRHSQDENLQEEVFDIIQKEDNGLEGFVLFHSIAAETGSCMRSSVMERLEIKCIRKMLEELQC